MRDSLNHRRAEEETSNERGNASPQRIDQIEHSSKGDYRNLSPRNVTWKGFPFINEL